jgi:hypothetical protein
MLEWRDLPDWKTLLSVADPVGEHAIRRHTSMSRPLGSEALLNALEKVHGRRMHPMVPGRPPKRPVCRISSETQMVSLLTPGE